MSLEKYVEKRKFDRTPEPAPRRAGQGTHPLQFCVQRHNASHLHYDFRLEVGGALKSWAVPKGPTLDPNQKHLAMMVEDHPLEYGGFEGVIPKGNYGAGSVMLWDRGTYELLGQGSAEEQLARGDFKFRLMGEKLSGEFAIVKMKRAAKGNEWLLLKKKDASAQPGWDPEEHARSVLTGRTQEEIARELPPPAADDPPAGKPGPKAKAKAGASAAAKDKKAEAKAKKKVDANVKAIPGAVQASMPANVAPMLAQLGKGEPPASEDWLFEVKWDGIRAIGYIEHGQLRLISRNGHAMERQYPELSILPHQIAARTAIFDGEIAALDARGVPSFELLQHRITVADAAAIATLARKHPVVFFAFDLLYLDGYDLRGAALLERKRLLKEILQPSDVIRYSDHFAGNGPTLLEAAKAQGLEGIVGKRARSLYESRRTADWVKWKNVATAEFVLCGFTKGERDLFGALILGIFDHSRLVWSGNVGTGFDRKMMQAIHGKLAPLATEKCPLEPDKNLPKQATWTRPELVCEVKFSNWTDDGRLRAPVFIGLRPDIDPEECQRERLSAELASNSAMSKQVAPPKQIAAPKQAAGNITHRTKRKTKAAGSAAADPAPDRGSSQEPLLGADLAEAALSIDGHSLKFTNLNKIFYPKDGYRKRDLLNYYDAVAPFLVPHLKDRPLSLKRYPNGIDAPYFFQKEAAESFPKWLPIVKAPDGIHYVIGRDRATLLFLVNLGCIDHNPWMSRVGSFAHPDYLLIDLDPYECGFEKIVEAALLVRAKLDAAELDSYPKTTGGDGMHIFVPLEPVYSYEQVRSLAQALSEMVAGERPDLFTTPRAVSRREKGKVYFDWAQIAEGKTISAPYVVRAYPGAPVATPLAWREVTPRLRPEQFNMSNALARFDRVGDLFEGVLTRPQKLDSAIEKLAGAIGGRSR
jgi:bifunctional non-homologous end joining protein LigD